MASRISHPSRIASAQSGDSQPATECRGGPSVAGRRQHATLADRVSDVIRPVQDGCIFAVAGAREVAVGRDRAVEAASDHRLLGVRAQPEKPFGGRHRVRCPNPLTSNLEINVRAGGRHAGFRHECLPHHHSSLTGRSAGLPGSLVLNPPGGWAGGKFPPEHD